MGKYDEKWVLGCGGLLPQQVKETELIYQACQYLEGKGLLFNSMAEALEASIVCYQALGVTAEELLQHKCRQNGILQLPLQGQKNPE